MIKVPDEMDISVRLAEKTLTDGSKVYDVELLQDGQRVIIPCFSQIAANHLLETLIRELQAHAVSADSISEGDQIELAA